MAQSELEKDMDYLQGCMEAQAGLMKMLLKMEIGQLKRKNPEFVKLICDEMKGDMLEDKARPQYKKGWDDTLADMKGAV